MHRSALRSSLLATLLGAHALSASLFAQIPTQCLEIESILVDACNPFATCDGSSEGQNEMVRFRTGPNPIALSDLEANWPNGTWRGIVQNTTTASITEQLNSTIVSCGFLLEPPGGVIPPGSSVLLVTSTEMCLVGNSFEALTDTIYLIFQNAGNTAGHFANSPAAGQPASPTPPVGMGVRTLILFDNATNCSDTVSYVRELLVNTEGTYGGQNGETDGGTVEFTWPGVPDVSYVNYGCQAPFDPLFVQAEVDGVLCGGTGTVTLTGEVIGGTFTSVQWQGGTGTFGDPNALNTTYTAGPGDLATVILTLCAQTDCVDPICGMVSIPAGNGPTVTMVPSGPVSLCPGDEVVLTATGADSYLWSTGETTGSISVTSLGTFSVVGTNACGTGSGSVEVIQATGVTVTISGVPQICPGQSTVLTASGASQYIWSTGDFTASITVTAPGIYSVSGSNNCGSATESISVTQAADPVVGISGDLAICAGESTVLSAAGATSYLWSNQATTSSITVDEAGTYTVTGTSVCGTAQASAEVVVDPLPTLSFSGVTQLCPGESTEITASGASQYVWGGGELTASITVTTPGIYSVTGSNNCGSVTGSVTVTVATSPLVSISGDLSICAGESTVLTATGADSFVWNDQTTTASITVEAAGTYTVTGTSACGTAEASAEVVVDPLPSASISGDPQLCAGQSATLVASGGDSYVWSTGATTASITVDTPGAVSVTASNSCGSSTASLEVVVGVPPTVTVSGNTFLCPGATTVLTATSATSVTWNTGASGSTLVVSAPGLYIASVSNGCGTDSDGLAVTASPLNTSFTAIPTSGLAPLNVQFNSTTTPVDATLSWDLGDGESSTAPSPTNVYTTPGQYVVELTATLDGCSSTVSQVILVTSVVSSNPSSITLPNVFTPNGDRHNDLLLMDAVNITSVEVLIYNRWGQKVNELKRVGEVWDGRSMSGEHVSDGTYFYTLVAMGADGVEHTLTGHITVLR